MSKIIELSRCIQLCKKKLNNYLYLDMSKANSMTSSGQCRLGPLIACIQG